MFTGVGTFLQLPVLENSAEIPSTNPFPPAEGATPLVRQPIKEGSLKRFQWVDNETGQLTIVWCKYEGLWRHSSIGLETETSAVETFRIHPEDPLSASVEVCRLLHLKRDSGNSFDLIIKSNTKVTCTKTTFEIQVQLDAFEAPGTVPTFRAESKEVPDVPGRAIEFDWGTHVNTHMWHDLVFSKKWKKSVPRQFI